MAGTSYTRQSSFSDGDTISASLFNNEYNKLVNAFSYASSGTTGHRHDGTAAEGGNIHTIGDQDFLNKIVADSTNNRWGFFVQVSSSAVEQIRIQDGAIVPVTDNDIDLGTSSLEFKDAYFDGTLYADAINFNGTSISATAAELNILDGVTSTAAELNILDGVTATAAELNYSDTGSSVGTVVASKVVTVDSNKDVASFRNITLTGELDAGSLDISGDADIDGTTNLDAVDIDGAVQVDGTITVGVDDTGYDVKFFGATASSYMLWDESADDLILAGSGRVVVPASGLVIGSTAVTSTAAELNILDGVTSTAAELNILDGVTSTAAELNILDGVTSTTAELNILDGVTSTTAELNILDGVTATTAELNILDGVTSTTAELNILDGVTVTAAEINTLDGITAVLGELNALDLGSTAVGTAVASKAVILDSNKDYTGIRNFTITGELDAATLDISGDADIDGTTNLDVVDIDGAVDMASTLAVGGVVTANAGVVVDNITIDGTEIDLSSGDLTLDVAGDIIFDADGGNFYFNDGSVGNFLDIQQDSNSVELISRISDADFRIRGNDGGSTINALVFDMSAAGAATFNDKIIATELDISGNVDIDGTTNLDVVDIDGAVDMASTLVVSGAVGIDTAVPSDTHGTWGQLFLGTKGSMISSSGAGGLDGTWLTDNMYVDSDTGAFAYRTTNESSAYLQEGGVHKFYTQASGSAGAGVTLAEKMRMDSSGNVGVGSGAISLGSTDIALQVGSSSHSTPTIQIRSGTSGKGQLWFGDNSGTDVGRYDGYIEYDQSGQDFRIGTASTERMRLNATGLGIGTTSPSSLLHLEAAGSPTVRLVDTTNSATLLAYAQNTDGVVGTYSAHNMLLASNSTVAMTIDTSQNVGIGSTAPAATLDLGSGTGNRGIAWGGTSSNAHYTTIWSEYGTASLILGAGLKPASGAASFVNPYTGTYGYAGIELDSWSDDGIKFYVGADASRTKDAAITPTEAMRITTAGNVGIGVTSTGHALEVRQDGVDVTPFMVTNRNGADDDTTTLGFKNDDAGSGYVPVYLGTRATDASERVNYFFIAVADTDNANVDTDMRLIVDSTGYVGINEPSPDVPLHINLGAEPPAAGMLILEANSAGRQLRIQPPTDSDNGFIDYRGGNLTFLDDGVEVARFQAATSFNLNNKLQLYTTDDKAHYYAFYTHTDDTLRINYDNSGNDEFLMNSSGDLSTTGTITASQSNSDIRLKENIQVIPDAVSKVKSLRGVTFNFKESGEKSTGLIAQEVQEVLPEAVYTAPAFKEGDDFLALHYGNTVGLLVEAIKEQQTQIESLTKRIKELED